MKITVSYALPYQFRVKGTVHNNRQSTYITDYHRFDSNIQTF